MPYRQRTDRIRFRHVVAGMMAFIATAAGVAQAPASTCGDLANGYGPFDYRTDRDKLPIVERAHFTPAVEAVMRGQSGYLGGDLDYTLRAFPNHHRALIAVMNYGIKMKSPQPSDLRRPVECYFERALRFRPDDNVARMIYAKFLANGNRKSEALRELEVASVRAADNGLTQHNIGLIYLDLSQFDLALKQAHLAAALGFTGSVLRDQLVRAGRWQEPAPEPTASAAGEQPAAASAARSASAP